MITFHLSSLLVINLHSSCLVQFKSTSLFEWKMRCQVKRIVQWYPMPYLKVSFFLSLLLLLKGICSKGSKKRPPRKKPLSRIAYCSREKNLDSASLFLADVLKVTPCVVKVAVWQWVSFHCWKKIQQWKKF